MAYSIKTVSSRKDLPHRREPYWERVRAGVYFGYRTALSGTGNWIARRRDEDGKQKYCTLGHCESFDEARKQAEQWADSAERGIDSLETTVGDACRLYVDYLRLHKSKAAANDAERRFKALVFDTPFARIKLAKLTTKHVREWLSAQVRPDTIEDEDDEDAIRRDKKTANRNLDSLKAAFNMALRDQLVATDAGWKTVFRFKGVSRRRERFLTLAERTSLTAECPDDLATLCKAMMLTAARPGELANASVCDFDHEQGTLTLDGKTGRRTVTVSTAAMAFFREQAKGRIGKAPLLRRETGERWAKDAWKKVFKRAVLKAKLPNDTVLYSLRHAAISEFIAAGMDSFLVAKLAGTSTAMIDQHYGHLRHDRTRAAMDAVKVI